MDYIYLNTYNISFNSFDILEDEDGDRYLKLDRTTRKSAASIDELLVGLETLYASRPAGSFAIKMRPEISQRRLLAFGYN